MQDLEGPGHQRALRVFIYDPKTFKSNSTPLAQRFPYRFLPSLDSSHLKVFLKTVFSSGAFRNVDVAAVFDGRVASIHSDAGKALKQALKAVPVGQLPAKNYVEHQYFFNNQEFVTGYAKPRSMRNASSTCLCSHVENAFVIRGKAFEVPTLDRKFLDLPGSNRSRGWACNKLLAEKDHIVVSGAMQKKLYTEPVTSEKVPQDGEGSDKEKDDTSKGKEKQADQGKDDTSKGKENQADDEGEEIVMDMATMLWPWQNTEDFWKEWLLGLRDDSLEVLVVTPTPSVPLCLACARTGIHLLGFCFNETHRAILSEALQLRVTCELLLGNRQD